MKTFQMYEIPYFDTFCDYVKYLADTHGDKVGIVQFSRKGEREAHSYRDLGEDTFGLARMLRRDGFAGAHIGIVSESSYDYLVAFLAINCAGAVAVTIDTEQPDDTIRTMDSVNVCYCDFFNNGREFAMSFLRKNWKGILLCLAIAVPAWFLVSSVKALAVVGAPVIAILAGMLVALLLKDSAPYKSGVSFTSKKVLQTAVVLLGFGLNLATIGKVGKASLPVIVSTITTSLVVAWVMTSGSDYYAKVYALSFCFNLYDASAQPTGIDRSYSGTYYDYFETTLTVDSVNALKWLADNTDIVPVMG